MTCNDCICFERCVVLGVVLDIKHNKEADKNCRHFKNKADFVEVVRCSRCNYCEIVTDQFDNDWYFCKKTKDNAEVKPDGFCSYGERSDT